MTARSGGPAPPMRPTADAPHARTSPANPYDRSRGFAPRSLPMPPPAVRCRGDAVRDHDRLASAFKQLLAMPLPSPSPSPSSPAPSACSPPRTPRPEFDAFDEAIAAANALSDTLCEWRLAIASSVPGTSQAEADGATMP